VTDLELAQARASLLVELGGGSARIAARRVSHTVQEKINDPDCAQLVRMASDQSFKAQVLLRASAILNGNDIAASVSSADRAALAELIDADTRAIALTSRPLAKSATGDTGEAVAANIKAALPELAQAFQSLSPFMETPQDEIPDIVRLQAATEMAMASLDDTHV